jgi:transcriptional regulator with XRE-family HTH domain
MRQNTLAAKLGIDAGSLCSLENGRRPPPRSNAFYAKLGAVLELTDDESKELRNLAELTRKFGSALSGTSPYQLRVALEFSRRLSGLRPPELRAIQAILEMGEDKNPVSPALTGASDTR